jgi:hypothetical protein
MLRRTYVKAGQIFAVSVEDVVVVVGKGLGDLLGVRHVCVMCVVDGAQMASVLWAKGQENKYWLFAPKFCFLAGSLEIRNFAAARIFVNLLERCS